MLSSKALRPTTPLCRWKSSPRSALPRNHQLRLLPSSNLSFPHHSAAPPSTSSSDATTASTSFCVTDLSSSIGTPPSTFTQWSLDQRHMLALNAVACVAALSASWLLFSAIPTLLAFKRAAESMEKLLDATREELPNTMAAVRLTGMEISDLTMELSDLGQEITEGVRNSTRAVRIAEERLRHLTSMTTTEKKLGDAPQSNTSSS
ncbi:uncharacterized protein LOC116247008 isoform X2 [Nymphaea colorata]|uniref:uncharacterized protein LOC116247008 isoform X2 n=1 Tax=Nymphaea colorata TaxID=210225 RepID=UPI00129D8583|nr:uncharacterized protein LOC116247008 isoform X2 [Nymphaea colorata]